MENADYYELKGAQWASEKQLGVWLTLALYATFAWRVWLLPVQPVLIASVLVYCGACSAAIAWRHSRWRASFARWRETLAVLLCLSGTGCGAWAAGTGKMMQTWPCLSEQSTAVLFNFILLVFASGGPSCLHHALAWKMRLWLRVVVQVALVASILPHHRSYCAVPVLASPDARSAIHFLYRLFSKLAYMLPLPQSPLVAADSTTECVTLLTWLCLLIGLLSPLLWEARTETSAFQRHQRRRQQAGLPPEHGVHTVLFNAIHFLFDDGQGIPFGAVICVLLAISWDWCAVLSVPKEARGSWGG